MAHVLRPDGTFIGRLAKARLDQLYQGFTKNTMGRATSALFAEAVGALLSQYRDGYRESAANKTKLHNHWATPEIYMHALGLSIDTERFASPLNCSAHLTKYFSRYDEDGAFGANIDAFSCRWAGASEYNAEYEPGDMNKAAKWAIASAMASDSPSLTAFVLPWWEDTAYFKWMIYPLVYTMVRIPAAQFKFKKPDFWSSGGPEFAGSPRWDVSIFIVSNAAGFQYVNQDLLLAGVRHASRVIGGQELVAVLHCPCSGLHGREAELLCLASDLAPLGASPEALIPAHAHVDRCPQFAERWLQPLSSSGSVAACTCLLGRQPSLCMLRWTQLCSDAGPQASSRWILMRTASAGQTCRAFSPAQQACRTNGCGATVSFQQHKLNEPCLAAPR